MPTKPLATDKGPCLSEQNTELKGSDHTDHHTWCSETSRKYKTVPETHNPYTPITMGFQTLHNTPKQTPDNKIILISKQNKKKTP